MVVEERTGDEDKMRGAVIEDVKVSNIIGTMIFTVGQ